MKKTFYLLIAFSIIILVVFFPQEIATATGAIKIGSACNVDDDCQSDNCMPSYPNAGEKYCACKSDDSCKELSADPEADWGCVEVPSLFQYISDPVEKQKKHEQTRDLNYCQSDKLGYFYALSSNSNASQTPPPKKDAMKIIVPKLNLPIPALPTWSSYEIKPGEPINIPWIADYIIAIYKYAIIIGSVLAVVAVMIGGVLYLTAGGLPQNIERAKGIIVGSLTGLIILICSYLVLNAINPELVNLKSLTIETVKPETIDLSWEGGYVSGDGSKVSQYNQMSCPGTAEGTQFDAYTTGYYLPPYGDKAFYTSFECNVGMQCRCPNGRDQTQTCSVSTYPKTWHPCNPIPTGSQAGVDYCNITYSHAYPVSGTTIACDSTCFKVAKDGCEIFIDGHRFICQDTGGGIKGRHLDVLSSTLGQAKSQIGVHTVTLGKNCSP